MTTANENNIAKLAGKYLTFFLTGEEYGIEILKIKEIIGLMQITPIPRTPDFVKGVVNLRGKVIPVIDLRAKFAMDPKEYDEETCIIVVEIRSDGSNIQLGLLVDAVSEVLNVLEEELEPTPSFGVSVNTEFILGMAKGADSVRTLLNIEEVLDSKKLDLLTEHAA